MQLISFNIQREMPTENGSSDPDDFLDTTDGGIMNKSNPPLFPATSYPKGTDGSKENAIIVSGNNYVILIKKSGQGIPVEFKIRTGEFYINLTINGFTPTFWKTIKIVDSEEEEFYYTSTEENGFGNFGPIPQEGMTFPIKVYLSKIGGRDGGTYSLFHYFIETPDIEENKYLYSRIDYDRFGRELLDVGYHVNYTPGGNENILLKATEIDYVLIEEYSTPPSEDGNSINAEIYMIRVWTKQETNFDPYAISCSLVPESYPLSPESTIWSSTVRGAPDTTEGRDTEGQIPTCVGYNLAYYREYAGSIIPNVGIMSDLEGQNLVFEDAEVSSSFVIQNLLYQQQELIEEVECGGEVTELCHNEGDIISPANIYSYEMLPTPEEYI